MKRYFILAITTAILSSFITATLQGQENEEKKALFKKASRYFFQNNFHMAEHLLGQVIKTDPGNGLAYAYLGDIYLSKEQYDRALEMFKKSIDLNTTRGENYFRIGQVHYYKKDGRLAIENFNLALENDSKLKFAYYHIGLSYLMLLRDKQNTIKNWETYLQIAPEDPQYEQIRRAIELLRDPNFVIPSEDSDMSIEEALRRGGLTLEKIDHKTRDKQADHETKKTDKKIEDLYLDDDL